MQLFCYSWKKKPDTRGRPSGTKYGCFIMAQVLRFSRVIKEENVMDSLLKKKQVRALQRSDLQQPWR